MIPLSEIPEDKILIYDIETNNQFAPYCWIRMIGIQIGLRGQRFLVKTDEDRALFQKMLADPEVYKVTFNGANFDNIVLTRHGYTIDETNMVDLFLVMKTICPGLPSYSMKFVAWWFFGDFHEPEFQLEMWAKHNAADKWTAPDELLEPYCLHDLVQTTMILEMAWPLVIKPRHWGAYQLDMSNASPLMEMELVGGVYLDEKKIDEGIATLQWDRLGWESHSHAMSDGMVDNPNSSAQLGRWLLSEGFEVDLTDSGNFCLGKSELLDLIDLDHAENDQDPIARCAWEIRQINAQLKYLVNYREALNHCPEHLSRGWIPMQESISNAGTRRYTSNSMYKINFQNASKSAKKVQLVPPGFLGIWIDSTQVENVVHIYESDDLARRLAYTADPDWNEYVWIGNQVLGTNLTKKELDSMPSPQFPGWSLYKQFKTIKLALNFGMGVTTFCNKTGVDKRTGRKSFDMIYAACPAILGLQERVRSDLVSQGYVQDVFGHIYTGSPRMAYKVVAYLVQGTGTGSLPKAQIRANWETLRSKGRPEDLHMCGMTHDEQGMRINLAAFTPDEVFATLQELMENMTTRFTPWFGGIPLRAKLALSRTTCAEQVELDLEKDRDKIYEMCRLDQPRKSTISLPTTLAPVN